MGLRHGVAFESVLIGRQLQRRMLSHANLIAALFLAQLAVPAQLLKALGLLPVGDGLGRELVLLVHLQHPCHDEPRGRLRQRTFWKKFARGIECSESNYSGRGISWSGGTSAAVTPASASSDMTRDR